MLLGTVVWFVRLVLWWLRDLPRRLRRPPPFVGFLIEAPPSEAPPPRRPFWQRFVVPSSLTVSELAARLRAVTAEPRVKGVVLHLRPVPLDGAQVGALRELIADVRAAGMAVTCWASSYNTATYRVACAANEVLLQPGGQVGALGVARQYVFLTEALERVGVRADMLKISPYKTAADAITERGLTPEAREMADWLAEDDFARLVADVAAGRRQEEVAARALVDGTPCTDRQALSAGLVDAVVTEEELAGRLGSPVLGWDAARKRLPRPRPPRPGRAVGLIRIEGMIIDGRSRRAPMRPPVGPPLLFEDQCGDLSVVEQARALAANPRVGAVVLWVNSGGGSATASEAMAAALAGIARRKPLVAAMSAVAASGGYYVTTPARRVFAHSGTLTGSIGVLGGKVVAGGLFDRLLFRRELVRRGEHVAMSSVDAPYTETERRKVRDGIDRTYELFLERVATARGRAPADIQPVAGGRVWTGHQALEHGLVDELGGLERAIVAARRLAGLPPDAPVREPRGGRRDLAVAPATAPAVLAHALRAVAALNQAGAWLLCPLVSPDTAAGGDTW
jgi:protease IV